MKGLNLLFAALMLPMLAHAKAIVAESYTVTDMKFLSILKERPELTLDHIKNDHFEVHGPEGLGAYLDRIGAPYNAEDMKAAMKIAGAYPTHEQLGRELQSIAAAFPNTVRVFSIGKTNQGRELWVAKVSRNVGVDDDRPEFKYVANMHGDEIVGRELMMRLIRDLAASDGRDPWITKLLDEVQIYIMPSMNPDGAAAVRRGNAKWADLNRDFPDFSTTDNRNLPDGREIETQAMMRWQATRKFLLSANFHGGAEVVNYPWDTVATPHPLDALVKNLSLDYAKRAPYIGASTVFQNGITNGYAWYEVDGGMQDWSFHWYKDLQLTIELSDQKYPPYDRIDYYYQQNRPALINFIGRVREISGMRRF